MKKLFILFSILTTIASTAQSVGINADGSAANASAMLDVSSTTKGFLPPRMTEAERNILSTTAAAGLLIWCTNCGTNGELQVYNGTAWLSSSTVTSSIVNADISDTAAIDQSKIAGLTDALAAKAPLSSPTFTGTPTLPTGTIGVTQTAGDNTTALATTAFVTDAVGTAASGTTHTIGEAYGGGIVFYVTPDRLHGLIAETQDQSHNHGPNPGSGWFDAHDVISRPYDHSNDGQNYTDWRLPTSYELELLYEKRNLFWGFDGKVYWSSTSIGNENAWGKNFFNGQLVNVDKVYSRAVRAVRAF